MMQAPPAQVLPLRDIKLPLDPGYWPLAPGWWLVMVIMLVLIVFILMKWYRYAQKKRRWQQIDGQLSELASTYQQSNNSQKLLADVSVFLRRFVKYQLQQVTAISLSGQDWLDYLNGQQPGAFDEYEAALTKGVFQPKFEYDPEGLLLTTRQFIRQQVMNPAKPASNEVKHV